MTTNDDRALLSHLDDVYAVMRRVQGDHNNSESTKEYRCIGGGNCCKVGLVIPLMECHNIAKELRKEFWQEYESNGSKFANIWWEATINLLKDAFNDDDWRIDNEVTSKHCAFFSDKVGCTIYDYRPLICRAYGTITPVEPSCPRNRTDDGNVIIFLSNETDRIITRFETVLEQYNKMHTEEALSVFMPLGVLKYLLPEKEFTEFLITIDKKYLQAHSGYPHQMWKARKEAKITE